MLYDATLEGLRAALGTATFDAAWAEGRAMTSEQALTSALQSGTPSV